MRIISWGQMLFIWNVQCEIHLMLSHHVAILGNHRGMFLSAMLFTCLGGRDRPGLMLTYGLLMHILKSPDAGKGKGRPFRGLITDDCNGNESLCLIQHSLGDGTMMRHLASVGVMSFLLTEVRSDKISVGPRPRGEIGCRPFETPVQVRVRCVVRLLA